MSVCQMGKVGAPVNDPPPRQIPGKQAPFWGDKLMENSCAVARMAMRTAQALETLSAAPGRKDGAGGIGKRLCSAG